MAGGTLRHWRSRRSGCRQASPPPARNRRAGWQAYTRTCSRTVHRYFRQLTLKVQGSLACTRRAARRAATSQTSQHPSFTTIRLILVPNASTSLMWRVVPEISVSTPSSTSPVGNGALTSRVTSIFREHGCSIDARDALYIRKRAIRAAFECINGSPGGLSPRLLAQTRPTGTRRKSKH